MSESINLPNDNEIVEAMIQLLLNSDLESLSMKIIKQTLEKQFNCQLNEKKQLLFDTLNDFIKNKALEYEQANENNDSNDQIDNETSKPDKKVKVNAFTRPLQLSFELAQFIGSELASRPEVVKRLWAYIKENNLQNPKDKRQIICNDILFNIFKRKSVTMFSMNKVLSNLMKSSKDLTNNEDVSDDSGEEIEEEDNDNNNDADNGDNSDDDNDINSKVETVDINPKKRVKTNHTTTDQKDNKPKAKGLNKLMNLSDELSEFLGIEQESRCQVVKKLWVYIKANNLQNPNKKTEILLDEKLNKVFKTK